MTFTLHQGDCREVLATLDSESIDAIVTDPPYELGFMGKGWDNAGVAYDPATWRACARVLKPGGYLLAFGAPRTYHRLACAIEDAGFEIRDSLMWLFGSGFPKSLDVSKALDKAAGARREVVGPNRYDADRSGSDFGLINDDGWRPQAHRIDTAPATDQARAWSGWGTALKPAYEPIVMARKPLTGTVAANVLAHGVGAINIDACRIEASPGDYAHPGNTGITDKRSVYGAFANGNQQPPSPLGRWPANVMLDDQAAVLLDSQSAGAGAFAPVRGTEPTKDAFSGPVYGEAMGRKTAAPFYGDAGGASRFFYTSKTPRSEREFGLDDLDPTRHADADSRDDDAPGSNNPRLRVSDRRNDHPTVKPVDLMRWLCRLVTPPGGLICDPFLGSGSTGMAALDEGFRFVGIDLDAHYIEIARRRIAPAFVRAAAATQRGTRNVDMRFLCTYPAEVGPWRIGVYVHARDAAEAWLAFAQRAAYLKTRVRLSEVVFTEDPR